MNTRISIAIVLQLLLSSCSKDDSNELKSWTDGFAKGSIKGKYPFLEKSFHYQCIPKELIYDSRILESENDSILEIRISRSKEPMTKRTDDLNHPHNSFTIYFNYNQYTNQSVSRYYEGISIPRIGLTIIDDDGISDFIGRYPEITDINYNKAKSTLSFNYKAKVGGFGYLAPSFEGVLTGEVKTKIYRHLLY